MTDHENKLVMETLLEHDRVLALLFLVLSLAGCDNRREPPKAYPAVVIGSGCSTWGCVSHARILRGPNIHRTCKFYEAKLNVHDTVLVWIDGENRCRLY